MALSIPRSVRPSLLRLLLVSGYAATVAVAQLATDATDYIPPFLSETNSDFGGSLITTADSLAGTEVYVSTAVTSVAESSTTVAVPEPSFITTASMPVSSVVTAAPGAAATSTAVSSAPEGQPSAVSPVEPSVASSTVTTPGTEATPSSVSSSASAFSPSSSSSLPPLSSASPSFASPSSSSTSPSSPNPPADTTSSSSLSPSSSPVSSLLSSASPSSSSSSSLTLVQESAYTTVTVTLTTTEFFTNHEAVSTYYSEEQVSVPTTVLLSYSPVYTTQYVEGTTISVPVTTISSEYVVTPTTILYSTVETSSPTTFTEESVLYSTISSPTATVYDAQETVIEYITETSVFTTTFSTIITTLGPVAVTSHYTESGTTEIVSPSVYTSFVTYTTTAEHTSIGLATSTAVSTRTYTTTITAAVTSAPGPAATGSVPTVTSTSTAYTTYVITEPDSTYVITRDIDMETTFETVAPATITSEYLTTLLDVPLSTSIIKPSVLYSNKTETDTVIVYEAISLVSLARTVLTTEVTVLTTSTIESQTLETITAPGQLVTRVVPVSPEIITLRKRCEACEELPQTTFQSVLSEEVQSNYVYTTTIVADEPTVVVNCNLETSYSTITTDYVVAHASVYSTFGTYTTEVATTSVGTTVYSYPVTKTLSASSSDILYNVEVVPVATSTLVLTSYLPLEQEVAYTTVTGAPVTASETVSYGASIIPGSSTVYIISSTPIYSTSYFVTTEEEPVSTAFSDEVVTETITSTSVSVATLPGAVIVPANAGNSIGVPAVTLGWQCIATVASIVLLSAIVV